MKKIFPTITIIIALALAVTILFTPLANAGQWYEQTIMSNWGEPVTIQISPDMQKYFELEAFNAIYDGYACGVTIFFHTRQALNNQTIKTHPIMKAREEIVIAGWDENGKKWVTGTKEASKMFLKNYSRRPTVFTTRVQSPSSRKGHCLYVQQTHHQEN